MTVKGLNARERQQLRVRTPALKKDKLSIIEHSHHMDGEPLCASSV